jgi:hypothetical protein
MLRRFTLLTAAVVAWQASLATAPGQTHGGGTASLSPLPAMERVELLDGRTFSGLVESEDTASIYLIQIQRPPGMPMHLVVGPIERRRVALVHHLDDVGRARLQAEIAEFRNRAAIEQGRMDAVVLRPATADGRRYSRHVGPWFTLDSATDENVTRRVIVQMEQIFTAYRQMLPLGESRAGGQLRVVILGSAADYQAFMARLGLKIENRACFVQSRNLIVAGSDMAPLAAQMARVSAENQRIRRELDQLEQRLDARLKELAEQLKKDGVPQREVPRYVQLERARFQDQIKKKRDELSRNDRANARIFNDNTRQMFARLYHESFHAYLENYVYPHRRWRAPLWLNEGLAVMFESGLLEGGMLRVDAPNTAALRKLRRDLAADPLPLEKLLTADQSAFLETDHAHDTERAYEYAWGLAYYLAFEKHLVPSAALDGYIKAPSGDGNAVTRFEKLVGASLAKFEPAWRDYISTGIRSGKADARSRHEPRASETAE